MNSRNSEKRQMTWPAKVMTVHEVSNYLQIHPSTLYRMIRRSQIPAFRIGSDWRFNVEAIDTWRRQMETLPISRAKRQEFGPEHASAHRRS